jgi:hypothetical protein
MRPPSKPGFSCTSLVALLVLILAASPGKSNACEAVQIRTPAPQPAARQPWTSTRTTTGDTTVVRHAGIESAAPLTLLGEIRITGADVPGSSGFTSIRFVTPTPDGGVLLYDTGARRLIQFDADGRFARFIGNNGSGPGEFTSPTGIRVTPDGRIHVGVTYGAGHVFTAFGVHERSWPRLQTAAVTGLSSVNDRGEYSTRTTVPPPWKPDSVTPFGTIVQISAVIRRRLEGDVADTTIAPRAAVEPPMLPYRIPGGTQAPGSTATTIPLAAYPVIAYSSLDYWILGDPAGYTLTLLNRGAPLRIENKYTAVPASVRERQSLFDNHVYRLKARGYQFANSFDIVPRAKPAFTLITTDADGRIWVQLHREGRPQRVDTIAGVDTIMRNQYVVVDGQRVARAGAPNHPLRPPFPQERWVEPVAWDVFGSRGEYVGRLVLQDNQTWGNATGEKVWIIERDADDVPTLTRYRIARSVRR